MDDTKAGILAQQLVNAAGSKKAAFELIRAAQTSGKRGRPPGAQYFNDDEQLLWLAAGLRNEWQARFGITPSARAIISKLVDLCWRPPPGKLSVARNLLGCEARGASQEAVIHRLRRRLDDKQHIRFPNDRGSPLLIFEWLSEQALAKTANLERSTLTFLPRGECFALEKKGVAFFPQRPHQ